VAPGGTCAVGSADTWKQPVVVEKQIGCGRRRCAHAASRSHFCTALAYTLLSISSAHAISPAPSADEATPDDATKDFSGCLALTATGPALVIVLAGVEREHHEGVHCLGQKPRPARSKPVRLPAWAVVLEFAAEALSKSQAGIDLAHIPFQGIPEALTDTMAGRTHLFISALCQRHQFGSRRQGQSHCGDQHRASGPTRLTYPPWPSRVCLATSGFFGMAW
jgi:hypothetical protein